MTDLPERLERLYVADGTNYVQEAATEIRRLRADIERHVAIAATQANEIEKLRAEVERLRADAERLDYLDKHPREATIRIGGDMKACVFYGVSCDPKWSAREAIDAARAARAAIGADHAD